MTTLAIRRFHQRGVAALTLAVGRRPAAGAVRGALTNELLRGGGTLAPRQC